MSCTLNDKIIVDRLKFKPRNYSDMVNLTKELKSEVLHQLKSEVHDRTAEEEDKIVSKREMRIQTMIGFSEDLPFAFAACGGGQI